MAQPFRMNLADPVSNTSSNQPATAKEDVFTSRGLVLYCLDQHAFLAMSFLRLTLMSWYKGWDGMGLIPHL